MDTKVRHIVRKIFEDLRTRQPNVRTRKSDRINVDQMLDEFHEKNSSRKIKPLD